MGHPREYESLSQRYSKELKVQVISYHCGTIVLPVLEDYKTSFSEHEGSTTLTGTRTQFRRLVGDGHKIKNLAEFESCFLGLACIRTNHSYCPFLEEHNVS